MGLKGLSKLIFFLKTLPSAIGFPTTLTLTLTLTLTFPSRPRQFRM